MTVATDGERDLAALCARLVRRLRDVAPEDKLAATATNYLSRKRYLNPLRIKPVSGVPGTHTRCGYCSQDMLAGSECASSASANTCAMYQEFAATRKVDAGVARIVQCEGCGEGVVPEHGVCRRKRCHVRPANCIAGTPTAPDPDAYGVDSAVEANKKGGA